MITCARQCARSYLVTPNEQTALTLRTRPIAHSIHVMVCSKRIRAEYFIDRGFLEWSLQSLERFNDRPLSSSIQDPGYHQLLLILMFDTLYIYSSSKEGQVIMKVVMSVLVIRSPCFSDRFQSDDSESFLNRPPSPNPSIARRPGFQLDDNAFI